MKRLILAGSALLLAGLAPIMASAATDLSGCYITSQTCAPGCKTVTTSAGTSVQVCTKGTANVPAGALIDDSVACWDDHRTYACPQPVTNCNTDANCGLSNQTCLSKGPDGECASWQQDYTCSKQQKECTDEEDINQCIGVSTEGEENQPAEAPDSQAFNKAMQGAGLLQALQKGLSGVNPPTVFAGHGGQCDRSFFYFTNCCSNSLKKTGSGFSACSEEEVKLAAAKRAKTVHFISNPCCTRILGACVSDVSNYCVFDSMLARIVQEQGRAQLAAMAKAGAATSDNLAVAFPLYNGAGDWQAFTVNGNTVWAWQWPEVCSAPATSASVAAMTTTDQMDCPVMPGEVHWIACTTGTNCTAPTLPPPALPNDADYSMLAMNDSQPASQAISNTAILTPDPGCGTGDAIGAQITGNPTCHYTLTGLTPNAATLHAAIAWPLYSNQAGWTQAGTLGTDWSVAGMALAMSQSPILKTGAPAPTYVSIEYSATTGTDPSAGGWSSMNLPLHIPASAPVALGTTGVKIYGDCGAPYYQCDYHALGPAPVTPKPWGDPGCHAPNATTHVPNCTGFTLDEFMQLDLSKMNLGEWLSSVKPAVPDTAKLDSAAAANLQNLQNNAAKMVDSASSSAAP